MIQRFLSILLVLAALTACQSSPQQAEQTPAQSETAATQVSEVLTVEAFQQKLKTTDNALVLDVRTPEEVAEGTLPGATAMNFYDDNFAEQVATLDKDQPVFVYCKAGGRSGKTAKMLSEMGFKEVYDMEGGYGTWLDKNFPTSNDK